jgi:hypothetical protein
MTLPFAHLLDKLSDPQRMAELHDALAEVIQAQCRIKLVLSSQYVPSSQAEPAADPPLATTGEAPLPKVRQVASSTSESAPATPPEVEAGPEDIQVPEEIARWAEKHGGEVSILPP